MMKNRAMQWTGWMIVAILGIIPLALQAGDETVTGNLTVTGTSDLEGNTLSLGTRTDTSDTGWQITFTDGTNSYVDFAGTRNANVWRWWQNGAATLQLQMTLDNNNTLTLFDQSSTPNANIVLNPLGTSTFANSVNFYGAYNLMPNQVLEDADSVLTEGLADSRYLSSGVNVELPSQTLSDSNSVLTESLGDGRYVSSAYLTSGSSNTVINSEEVDFNGTYTEFYGEVNEMPHQVIWDDNSILNQGLAAAEFLTPDEGDSRYILNGTFTLTTAATSASLTGTITAGGTVTAPSFVCTAPTGDIPMYTGY